MITLTIVEKKKSGSRITTNRYLKLFKSLDEAKKAIIPISKEMKRAAKAKEEPSIRIDAVSYDSKSEKTLLLELDAITSIDNEDTN